MQLSGRVVEWQDDKGFGFIKPAGSRQKVFFHISALVHTDHRPVAGEQVTFELTQDAKGRDQACKVVVKGVKASYTGGRAGPVALVVVSVLILRAGFPFWMLGLFPAMSLFTYCVYAHDKRAAKKGRWRVSENTLHLLSLFGGWPGALYAQRRLRHKSQKQPFKFILSITVLGNVAALAWFFSPQGQHTRALVMGLLL